MEALIQILVFWLVCHGMTAIVTGGKAFKWLRSLVKPIPGVGYWITCAECFGFATGVLWYWLGLHLPFSLEYPVNYFAAGLVSSALCWVTRVKLHALGEDNL